LVSLVRQALLGLQAGQVELEQLGLLAQLALLVELEQQGLQVIKV
jgi:hypothetical protein